MHALLRSHLGSTGPWPVESLTWSQHHELVLLFVCACSATYFPLGHPICMRIYHGLLSRGAFYFTAISFPLGRLICLRIYRGLLSPGVSYLHALLSNGLKILLQKMPAHRKPDHELGSVVADYTRSVPRWRVQVKFSKSDLGVGPDRFERDAADADLKVVQAAGDRDKMRLAIQQLKAATVTQEMPPVTQVMIIGYLIFCVKILLLFATIVKYLWVLV